MVWNYSGDPSSSDLDAVRFLIGDTDPTEELLQDEEINYLLSQYNSVNRAAYYAVISLMSKFTKLVRQETGRIKVWAGDRYKHYSELADKMKKDIESGFGSVPNIFAGGISHADIRSRNLDPDQVQIRPSKGMHDNYR